MDRVLRLQAVMAVLCVFACSDDSLKGIPATTNRGGPPAQACVTTLDCDPGAECAGGVCVTDCIGGGCLAPGDSDGGVTTNNPGDGGRGGDSDGSGGGGDSNTPSDRPPMYIGGQWQTEYHLDWSDYMGPLAGLGTPLDILDQVLMGNLGIPLLDDLVDSYVPTSVGTVAHILNNLVHFFQDVRIDGRMSLAHVPGAPRSIRGTESWDWGYVYVIEQCPFGEMDPAYPDCALVAIPLNQYGASFGRIEVEALDFTGTIDDLAGVDRIRITDREVRMEMGAFIVYLIDMLINIGTNGTYGSLHDVFSDLIDCVGLQADIESLVGQDPGDMPFVEAICLATVDAAVAEIIARLDSVTVDWEVMTFDQRALPYDDNGDTWADRLAAPPGDPGTIENGEFETILDADMDGTWFGTRP